MTLLPLILSWISRWRGRQRLAMLDDRMLHDIGVTADQALQEVRKPFWRP